MKKNNILLYVFGSGILERINKKNLDSKEFFYGFFPDLEFDHEKEVKLLNKLIAEKPQKQFFTEGYYKYEGSNKIIPQKHLDHILWGPKKE